MSISPETINQIKTMLGVDALPLAWSAEDLDRLNIRSVHSLRRDRVIGGGIPFIKDKGEIKYPVLAVLEWMQKNLRASANKS